MPTTIDINKLSVTYPGQSEASIENISLKLESGKIHMLIGPNGSGKSTILKAIVGILDHRGTISFQDEQKKITRKNVHIGYVPQYVELDRSLPVTVREFLELTLTSCPEKTENVDHVIDNSLREVGAFKIKARQLGKLSGGQLQRVILARALLHDSSVLLLDEPESGVDMAAEVELYELLLKLKQQGRTIVIATHELEIVHEYADNVICINKTLCCQGKPVDALKEKTFKKLYGGHHKHYHGKHY